MPPLTRQSFHSWWSDSNSALAHGPTINLHAAAKPLMKLLYHRQALALIRKNRGKPLSGTMLDTYMSYFQWDFVLWSTKAAIFEDLAGRAQSKVDEARAVVDSPDFSYITQMLKSQDIGARISSCRLLGSLARHECTMETILELRSCAQLVSMLHDENSGVIGLAVYVLAQIACHLNGAQAIVDSRALVLVLELLESLPSSNIRKWTCVLTGKLASHGSTLASVLELKPYAQIVPLLSDKDYGVVDGAAHALSQIGRSLEGAQAIVDAGALGHVLELLESPSSTIRKWTCKLVGNLAWHHSTRTAVLALKPFQALVTLLSDKDSRVVSAAAHALSQIAHSLDGAQAIVDARGLDHVSKLLKSPTPNIRKWTCKLVGNLAWHHSIRAAVLALKPYESLVSLLSDKCCGVLDGAAHAVSQIARSLDGALAIVDAGALGHVSELLESPSSTIRKWTCLLAGNLVWYDSTRAAVLALKPYKTLVSLLSDRDSGVVEWAVYALWRIARSLDGAQAVVNAGALVLVLKLLQSPSHNSRKWTCELVGKLASHELTLPAILELEPSEQLLSCLREPSTRPSAIFALLTISDGRMRGYSSRPRCSWEGAVY
ncbi:hypothetical protein MVEN_01351300 [Mycena venus]|uniref:ARM repeat-containing protein n=1 Tax=Mycena venus TaxID=2733690 RepID=A0A8H7CX06_9AGAR|nr:hypothetical protein MVEN_01351300 [Mycena venus]